MDLQPVIHFVRDNNDVVEVHFFPEFVLMYFYIYSETLNLFHRSNSFTQAEREAKVIML